MTCKIACLLLYHQFLNIKNKAQVYQFRLVMDNRLMRYPQEKQFDFVEMYIRNMKNMTDNRPLSPHLSIHKRVLTAVFSIFHRISGIGLSIGAILISIWFFLISFGPEYYIYFETLSKKCPINFSLCKSKICL